MLREGFRFGVKSNENQNEIIYAQMEIKTKQKYKVNSSGVVLVVGGNFNQLGCSGLQNSFEFFFSNFQTLI